MCGIAGILHYKKNHLPVPEDSIARMLTKIRHRGPDESGIYIDSSLGMGNVRLSIIDLETGSQPLSVRNERYWIVYNGELFNYPELKLELQARGCEFYTSSDTEVVLQAFAEFGPECLSRFNGQFAIAIWDTYKRELFLARDRAGIRPLFYTDLAGSFYFCSEIKGLFENQEIPRSFSIRGLAQVFRYWTTLTPLTPYEGVYELPPAHYMVVNSNGITIHQFWKLKFPSVEGNRYAGKIEDSLEEFRELLLDAVRIRLRADVEVAAYLSGGIDSSATTAMIHAIEPGILNTFSIGFSDKLFDETKFQLEAANYFNTHHTAITCTPEEIGEYFADAVYFAEYPLLRTAPVPMYLLSKKVREQNIKVVITGEGADEVLAGYNIFKEAMIRRFWSKFPESHIRPILLKKLYPYLPVMKDSGVNALRLFYGFKLSQTTDPYYSHLIRWHNTSRIQNYFTDQIIEEVKNIDPLEGLDNIAGESFAELTPLAKSQTLEFTIFMSNYLLSSQGDRMAMGNSVEGRYPFLDYRVIDKAASLPDNFKLKGLNEKFILKKMMQGKIPQSILERSKQAYRAPVSDSFFGHIRPAFMDDLLSDKNLLSTGIFNPDKVTKLIQKLSSGLTISEIDNMAIAGIISTLLIQKHLLDGIPLKSENHDLKNLKVIIHPR